MNVSNELAAVFQMEQAVEHMRRSMGTYREFIRLDAELRREKFNQLRDQGFTDAQALELCKGRVF